MKERIQERLNDRGQVGIGTLIVFIAMVLVAAIAAGVLINTAGFLQTKSEQTGEESSAQVSNRVQVVSGFGDVVKDNAGNDEAVAEISLTVMRGSGSNDINLSASTIEWIGPQNAKTLTYHNKDDPNADKFTVDPIKDSDDSEPVLNDQDDRFEISLQADEIGAAGISGTDAGGADDEYLGLGEGESVELKLTTQHGAVTVYRANIPQSLSKESAVEV